jgi:hypothetical protein
MLIGGILLALAAVVLVAGAVCWLAGVQLMALAKLLLAAFAVCFTVAGAAVVTGDLLHSAGYFDSGRGDPGKEAEVTPPSLPPAPAPLTEQEQQGAAWMHRNAVEIFIARPGFGLRRMPLAVDEFVTGPKSLSQKDPANKFPGFGTPFVYIEEKAGEKKAIHYPVQDIVGGWGFDRIAAEDPKEQWKLRKVYLVGLVKHPEPVVYLTDTVPDMKEPKDVPTRELDAFEKASLESLRGGENLRGEKRGKGMRALGPIYAGAACVKCHDQKGQLLGAFTYTLERVPVPPQERDADEQGNPLK